MEMSIIEKSPKNLRSIAEKVFEGKRISSEDGITLYKEGEPGFLGILANHVRENKNGSYVYFNRNLHIEPTNLCVFDCKFCSYSRLRSEEHTSELQSLRH